MATRLEERTGSNADPLEGSSLPAWTYSDPEFFAAEQERVFAPSWQLDASETLSRRERKERIAGLDEKAARPKGK